LGFSAGACSFDARAEGRQRLAWCVGLKARLCDERGNAQALRMIDAFFTVTVICACPAEAIKIPLGPLHGPDILHTGKNKLHALVSIHSVLSFR